MAKGNTRSRHTLVEWVSGIARPVFQNGNSAMGTWGAGNFDSDAALDFVGEQIRRYIALINEVFAVAYRFRLDEEADGELIPSVEILILLCEHCGGVLPSWLDVAAWKQRYLAMYDAQISGLAPVGGYGDERRAVIESTFDRLFTHQR